VHVGEVQATIVNAIQATLGTIILPANPGQETGIITKLDIQRMHAMVFTRDNQLSKHHGGFAVECSISDVVLPGSPVWGVKNEIARLVVEGRRRRDRGNVRAMTGFGHGETTRDFERHNSWQPLLVVVLGSQVRHCCPKETPLNSRLDL